MNHVDIELMFDVQTTLLEQLYFMAIPDRLSHLIKVYHMKVNFDHPFVWLFKSFTRSLVLYVDNDVSRFDYKRRGW